jgi:hypothetical protein
MPVPDNAETIWNYLTSHGLNDNAVAGIEGNIEQESGGDPSAGVWPENYGLIQWTPANDYFSSPPDLQQQLTGIMTYIEANGSVAAINAASDNATDAALYFGENYERPLASEANYPNREQSAVSTLQAAQSGKWPSSTGGTAGASAGSSTASNGSGFDITDPSTWIPGILSGALGGAEQDINDILERGALIIFGAVLIIVGLVRFTSAGPKIKEVARKAAPEAAAA